MPLKVLAKHGIVDKDRDFIHLNVQNLTLQQKAQIRCICEQKLQEFVQKKGLGIWDYRLLETDPVPDNLRFQVLKESGGRCALCGITKNESPLDVDHVIPRSRGGSNDYTNLQVLCAKCNRTKRDKDTTDFRKPLPADKAKGCLFCSDEINDRIVIENGPILAIYDKYPVTLDHTLIIPKRHAVDYFQMTALERQCADEMIQFLRKEFVYNDPSINGFNVGMNCGETAGQTVMHAHIHLIPRRKGDTENPRGGVRHVIPDKGYY